MTARPPSVFNIFYTIMISMEDSNRLNRDFFSALGTIIFVGTIIIFIIFLGKMAIESLDRYRDHAIEMCMENTRYTKEYCTYLAR